MEDLAAISAVTLKSGALCYIWHGPNRAEFTKELLDRTSPQFPWDGSAFMVGPFKVRVVGMRSCPIQGTIVTVERLG